MILVSKNTKFLSILVYDVLQMTTSISEFVYEKSLAIIGNTFTRMDLAIELIRCGVTVTFNPHLIENGRFGLLLVNLETENISLLEKLTRSKTTWIVWCHGSADLISQAYDAGALAVFPQETQTQTLCQFIERHLANLSNEASSTLAHSDLIQRRYRRGDFILLDADMVLSIEDGIIARMMIHQDGCQVLLGLFGRNDLIFPHPADNCYIQLVAQNDCIVKIESLAVAEKRTGFTQDLRFCLQKVEAWAAMQARPHLDQRLLGILSLLAEEFGQNNEQGRVINLRLTHAQLALAIGSTRATVTRTISDLKLQNKLTTIGTEDGERFCLLAWEKCSHFPSE